MTLPPTIVHNLARGHDFFGDRLLLVTESGAVSYVEFAQLVEGAAARLADEGMVPGDRLAVCLRNGLEIAVAIWACARGGFIFAGLPTHVTPSARLALIDYAEPALLLAAPEFLDGLPGTARPVGDILTGRRLPWRANAPLPDPNDVYALIYTSGTTGRPKAATVTHRAAMYVAGVYRDMLNLTPGDVTAIHLPFYYVSGHISQLNPFMLAGGSAVTMREFTPRALNHVGREFSVTVLDVVPWMLSRLLHEAEFSPTELPVLRTVFFGGSPMPSDTLMGVRERFPGVGLYNVYGMTETGGVIAILPGDEIDGRADTVGRTVPGSRITIAADGEILVRGPMVTGGYWRNQEATRSSLDDGWLHTGDAGSIDAAGYLYVNGRVTDLINRAGLKVLPLDVERALLSHPDVADAAAVGLPDGAAGEVVAACVVASPGAHLDVEDVRGWVRARLPVHARPRQLRVLDEVPRNATGKVDRVALRKLLGRPGAF